VALAATASAKSFTTLAIARFFLGVFESCLNPGFVLITSSWWKREEQAARIGIWYCANGLIGVPSGVIFWGIAHLNVGSIYIN
jgi:ACS family allantoate permease-like MFS transporter